MKEHKYTNPKTGRTFIGKPDIPIIFTTPTNAKRAALINNNFTILSIDDELKENVGMTFTAESKLQNCKNIFLGQWIYNGNNLQKHISEEQFRLKEYFEDLQNAEWPYIIMLDNEDKDLNRLFNYVETTENAYHAVLNHIPIINDQKTEWQQIDQFLEDSDSVNKYRNLRLWIKKGLSADTISESTDIIGQKIENYRWAIKKHGFETSLGAVKLIFSKSSLIKGIGAGLGSSLIGGEIIGALSTGLVFAGELTAYLIERKITKLDLCKKTEFEVAIIYDINRKFNK